MNLEKLNVNIVKNGLTVDVRVELNNLSFKVERLPRKYVYRFMCLLGKAMDSNTAKSVKEYGVFELGDRFRELVDLLEARGFHVIDAQI